MPTNVLIIENEPSIAASLRTEILRMGHHAAIADNAVRAWELLSVVLPDLILLNRTVPGTEGRVFAQELRQNKHTQNVPFIVLGLWAPKSPAVDDRYVDVEGFVARPSRQEELLARVSAILRRRQIPRLTDEAVSINGLMLDPASRKVSTTLNGKKLEMHVRPTEFRLLYFFMTHPGRVFSRADLLEQVWGDHDFLDERSVNTYVRRLRKSLEPGACQELIEAVRGFGYRFISKTGTPDE